MEARSISMMLECPGCGEERPRNKKGLLVKFCAECGFSYQDEKSHPVHTGESDLQKSATEQLPVMDHPSPDATTDSTQLPAPVDSNDVSTRSTEEPSISGDYGEEPPCKLSRLTIDSGDSDTSFVEDHGDSFEDSLLDVNGEEMNFGGADPFPLEVRDELTDPEPLPDLPPIQELTGTASPQAGTSAAGVEETIPPYTHDEVGQTKAKPVLGRWASTSALPAPPPVEPAMKRSQSAPCLRWVPANEQESSQQRLAEDLGSNDSDSDDEIWSYPTTDVKDTTKEDATASPPTASAPSSVPGYSNEPMDQDNDAHADMLTENESSDEKKTSQQDSDPVAHLLTVFKTYKENIEHLKRIEASADNQKEINKLSRECNELLKAYEKKERKQLGKNGKSSQDGRELTWGQRQALLALQKFVNENSRKLNVLFERVDITPVADTNVKLEKQRTQRRMTFMAVLSTSFVEYFKQRNVEEPVVEICCFKSGQIQHMVTLYRTEQHVWMGEFSTPISQPAAEVQYAYVVHDGDYVGKHNWEWLHRGSKKTRRSVTIGGSDSDKTVFDGIILPSERSEIWQLFTKQKQIRNGSLSVKDTEYIAGVKAMLPNWVEEIEKGSTLCKIRKWMDDVWSQQLDLLTGFNTAEGWQRHSATRLLDKVLNDYVETSIGQHMELVDMASQPWDIISSMIGLLHLANLAYEHLYSPLVKHQSLCIAMIKRSMEKSAELINQQKLAFDVNELIKDMVEGDDDFKSSLGDSLLSTMQAISSYTTKDDAWIALVPFVHLLPTPHTTGSKLKKRSGTSIPNDRERSSVFDRVAKFEQFETRYSMEEDRLHSGNSSGHGQRSGLGATLSSDQPSADYKTTEWWGASLYDKAVKSIRRWDEWRPQWSAWLGWLKPWFKYVPKLSHSFIYMLSPQQLIMLLNSDVKDIYSLPLDAIIAKVKLDSSREVGMYRGLHKFVEMATKRTKEVTISSVKMCAEFLNLLYSKNNSQISSEGLFEIVQTYLIITDIYCDMKKKKAAQSKASGQSSSKSAGEGSGGRTRSTEPTNGAENESDALTSPLASFVREVSDIISQSHWSTVKLGGGYGYRRTSYQRDAFKEGEIQVWTDLFRCNAGKSDVSSWWQVNLKERFRVRLHQVAQKDAMAVVDLYCNHAFEIPSMDQTVADVALVRAEHVISDKEKSAVLWNSKLKGKIGELVDRALSKMWNTKDDSEMTIVKNMIKWGTFLSVLKFYEHLPAQHQSSISEENKRRLKRSLESLESVCSSLLHGTIRFEDFDYVLDRKVEFLNLCAASPMLTEAKPQLEAMMPYRSQQKDIFQNFNTLVSDLWQECKSAVEHSAQMDNWLSRKPADLVFNRNIRNDDVICVHVPQEIRNILEPFQTIKSRRVFAVAFQEQVLNTRDKMPFKDIANLYENAVSRFHELCAYFNSGDISIKQFEDYHKVFFNNDLRKLKNELPHMVDAEQLPMRTEQVALSAQVDHCHKGAQMMLDMKKLFRLTGDFSAMDHILESKDKSLKLINITPELLKQAATVRDITLAQQTCLKAFSECTEFVKWVVAEVPRKDISNFVDLASSTLGEDDLAAQKTRYLLNALTGYAPLIYYDFEAQETSYDRFMVLCNEVWETLKQNPELEQNLRNSSNELEWIKKVKSHFGDVEISSIAQATAINESGKYRVGNVPGFTRDFMSLDDLIALKCQFSQKAEGDKNVHNYSALKELQSKLTLVAGDKQKQNQDTIQTFDEMKDAIENIAKAYMQIRKEGCIQFDNVYVEVDCSTSSSTAVKVHFKSNNFKFKGYRLEKSALEHCQDIHQFLVDCLEQWRVDMDRKRMEHPELNYYTTEQVVALRKELALFMSADPDDDQQMLQESLPLLAMIHSVSSAHLRELIASYVPRITEEMDTDAALTSQSQATQEQIDLVDEILEEFGGEELPRDLLLEAVRQNESFTQDEYIQWTRDRQQQLNQERPENSLRTSDDLLASLFLSIDRKQPLLKQLQELWTGFVKQTDVTISNFLSLEHLGYILQQLRKAASRSGTPRRIPFWIERGRPHLIAAPRKMTYKVVLSLYATDEKFPAPSRSEVLICNNSTRLEQVTVFLKRAFKDPISFYCLVNCHLLDYAICREIELMISQSRDTTDEAYGLAFIYTEEVKDARIRAYLDKYLVKHFEVLPAKQLKRYVGEKLKVPPGVRNTACAADPDRSLARLIRSSRAGVGKSLQKKNMCRRLREDLGVEGKDITIPVYKTIDTDSIIHRLLEEFGSGFGTDLCHTIHLDIAHEVESGVDELLFNLIILRSIVNSEGVVWQAQTSQYYIIECMPHIRDKKCAHEVLDLLPSMMCITPEEALQKYNSPDVTPGSFIGFDEVILMSREWQIVLKFLQLHSTDTNDNNYLIDEDEFTSPADALTLLISYCGLRDPAWSELRHYVYFLSDQLFKVEQSPFCGHTSIEDMPGFRRFVVQFMFRMAKDFATRSLKIAEETPGVALTEIEEEEDNGGKLLDQLGMKRTWESGNHPYLFFNEDGMTLTPLGFFVKNLDIARPFSLVDCETEEVLLRECIARDLKRALDQTDLKLTENFRNLTRGGQLKKLRDVMVKTCILSRSITRPDGSVLYSTEPYFTYEDDPDDNYVLTMDNAKKILAIHQRLRVNIPVIIMGETGCGKTKLIEFMSKLQIPTMLRFQKAVNTMVTVKVHGGTLEEDIIKKVEEAQQLARDNQRVIEEYISSFDSIQKPTLYTILFLDEANTTEAIGLVKEILCDGRMKGKPLDTECGLKIIAACNPYRRHTPDMIEKLKKAGLGYSVSEEKTKDKFGQIPMRHLVYRVQPLSQSLLPLVWDFGTLRSPSTNDDDAQIDAHSNIEATYIQRMIVKWNHNHRKEGAGLNFRHLTSRVVSLLAATHAFMREQKDECSFVSLRDIQRVTEVSGWFFDHRDEIFTAMDDMDEKKAERAAIAGANTQEEARPGEHNGPVRTQAEVRQDIKRMLPQARCLLLAMGVCYLARLEQPTRIKFVEFLRRRIEGVIAARGQINGCEYFFSLLETCQDLFISNVLDGNTHKNIAKNKALKENVFMMIVCIENRIPLFLVGKPGSSKSLSKAMVVDAMKGTSSNKDLFKKLKRAYMVAFQCSRHATPAGIVGVFKHCARFQKDQDLKSFVSVVVLDEVGLAEDSENMPLKTLHPLLEDGCEGNETPEPYMKCAFVGISNWSLDPAKMNRGIFVQRGTPDDNELAEIAEQICRPVVGDQRTVSAELIGQLARAYLDICREQKPEERDLTEFFGLRDFYSLMKMVINFANSTGRLNRNQLEHSIRRNFGGFDTELFDPMGVFKSHCSGIDRLQNAEDGQPPTEPMKLVRSSLSGDTKALQGMESRYLLILTENLSVLSIILDEFATHSQQPEVVFGSRFRDDVSYTQICRNISRIKNCMAMGKPVILLNLDDLYESLYDALNQYFSTWGDRKFVDIGLGTHRVKAFVDDTFRLVVIADKNKVHTQFPIPLINRLEKHYISATSLLTKEQRAIKEQLEAWANEFVKPLRQFERNSCPFYCDGCDEPLDQPYKMPCLTHYIGSCCREAIFNGVKARECPVDQTELSPEYEWAIDKAALENRQYFEKATPETVFIGYSLETTALVVRSAWDDVVADGMLMAEMETDDSEDTDELHRKVLQRAKYHLLQIATGESVLRVHRTNIYSEATRVESMYLHEQYHETLHHYLDHHLSLVGTTASSFIQVTSFAELMVDKDIENLRNRLNQSGYRSFVDCLFLKDFTKEDRFIERVRQMFEGIEDDSACRFVIVQCEAANESPELLDSVRYIIQRESETSTAIVHTVLLLNLPRGRSFLGYQGGKWKCVHIDDPRSPDVQLPPLKKCLLMKPSQIIGEVLEQIRPAAQDEEEMYTDDTDSERTAAHTRNLQPFIVQCLPAAVSVVKSSQVYDRVALLRKLFTTNSSFMEKFLDHVHSLLSDQENVSFGQWVKTDAAKASNMRQSETLRHALEDSLERAFVPALAAVIAFADVRENLQLLNSNSPLVPLWMQLFAVSHKLGLTFERLTRHNEASSRLPKSYKMVEVGTGHQQFRLQFPFAWIVKDTIDRLVIATERTGQSLASSTHLLVQQFRQTTVGQVIEGSVRGRPGLADDMLGAYLNDFVFMSYPCTNMAEHQIVMEAIKSYIIDTMRASDVTLVHIHIACTLMKQVLLNLPVVFNLIIPYGDKLITTTKQKAKDMVLSLSCDLVALQCLLSHITKFKVNEIVNKPEQWIESVEMCRPAVHQVFYNSSNKAGVEECRHLWKLLELKKLYVEHVILPTEPDSTGKRKPYKLVNLVKNVTLSNFHQEEGFHQLVNTLQETLSEGIRSLYPNCPRRCHACHSDLHSPVELPCKHFLCETCASSLQICSQENCGDNIPRGLIFKPESINMSTESVDQFKRLRQRLNKFFMHFVSDLVFSSEPQDQVLRWLVSRITYEKHTRQFSLFSSQDVVDPTPVIRSFLLKLLLKCKQSDAVLAHLDEIILGWRNENVSTRGDLCLSGQKKVQTMVLFMDCYKDLNDHQRDCTELAKFLEDNANFLNTPVQTPTVDWLKTLATLQCVLVQTVEYLTSPARFSTVAYQRLENSLRDFLKFAENEARNQQPGYMVARQLLDTTGEGYLKDLLNTPRNYLVPSDLEEILQSFTVPDLLNQSDPVYTDAKNVVKQLIGLGTNVIELKTAVGNFKKVCENDEHMMLQALFTRVTRSLSQSLPVASCVRHILVDSLKPDMSVNSKTMVQLLLEDDKLPKAMDVGQSKGIHMSMLVLNIYRCLGRDIATTNNLNPLAELVQKPQQAANHFLPTMADNQFEMYQDTIRKALQTQSENPVAYRCPNGHPYVIGNCGRPYYTATCHECGATIGGQGHTAHAGNQALGSSDSAAQSKKGHILGRQTSRGAAAPERDLSALSCAVLRCLTHLAMFTGSLFNVRQIFSMIQPALVRDDDVEPFLDRHIQLDLQHIANCCALSVDDCIILLHQVINNMKDSPRGTGGVVLNTITERKTWEREFDSRYIKPVFDQAGQQLEMYNARESNKVASVKDRLSTSGTTLTEQNLLATPGLWVYRRPLTLAAVRNLLQSAVTNCPHLTNMADNVVTLLAVRRLPDIVRLLRVLSERLHSQLTRHDAANISLETLCHMYGDEIEDLHSLVTAYIDAWNLMVDSKNDGASIDFTRMNMSSPLTDVLYDHVASRKGSNTTVVGHTPFVLINFLVEANNKMLSYNEEGRSTLPLLSVSVGNLVSLSTREELLDLILAHREYELKDTTVGSYDWPAIEREVLHKYISNKAKVNLTRDQLPSFVFQEDFNLHNQMEAIDSSQEMLPSETQERIGNALPCRVSALTVYLKDLKIVINYLSVMSHVEGDKSLAEYMESTLGKRPNYLTDDIGLKHVKHIWLIVKYTQTDLLKRQHQEPFDDLQPEYRAALKDDHRFELNGLFGYSSPRTRTFLQQLFEYITLRLNKLAVNSDPEDSRKSLRQALGDYIMKHSEEMEAYSLMQELPNLPDELKVAHASKSWEYIWTRYTTPIA